MKRILTFLFLVQLFSISGQSQKLFTVNFTADMGKLKNFNNVNGGPGKAVAGYQDAGVKMIRTHDMTACDYMNYSQFWKNGNLNYSFNPTDSTLYNWNNCNIKIDSITRFGFVPFFRFGISFSYTKDTLFTRPPYDSNHTTFSKFSEVCKRTIMHYNNGWAGGFAKNITYWEIWNEPDGGFWHGDSVSFYKMFKEVGDSLKKNFPDLQIGGPGVLSGSVVSRRQWVPAFIRYCKNNSAKMDFFSWHLYSQFNPYAIAVWGNYIRTMLDTSGYAGTESVVSEMNIDLGQNNNPNINSPKGAAYIASTLISAQMSKIDKILVYRGEGIMNMLNNDSLGLPNFTWNGLGFKSYSVLYNNTPNGIEAGGSEFVTGEQNARKDTTNLMILAGRSDDNKSCSILISNYNSSSNSCTISLQNLPWQSSGTVTVTKNITNNLGNFFTQSTETISGNSNLSITVNNIPAPSVVLLRLAYTGDLTNSEAEKKTPASFQLAQNFPNPFNPETIISYQLNQKSHVTLEVFDIVGNNIALLVDRVQEPGNYHVPFSSMKSKGLAAGMYFYRLKADNQIAVKKMVLLR
ncbi:MAG: T9SS type A sorting domain-containing protein [Ignavibacteriales bacterium]|nr:T9SS type A sorting domain-containing protein [Ignavibacteriales bacterium]